MRCSMNKSAPVFGRLMQAALALGIGAAGQASAATKEVTLATPAQALTYCQSGKMPGSDIAYINGGPGLVQYGPSNSCAQKVATKITVTKAIQVNGKRVSECNLSPEAQALTFCNDGEMGEWDIDYIKGKIGKTINGPGYGCTVNDSTSGIANAICK